MKKTLFTFFVAVSVVCANAATVQPVYSWDWTSGKAEVNATGWTEFSYTEGNTYATYSPSARPYKNNMTEFEGSFTFSMDIRKPTSNDDWTTLLSLYSNSVKTGGNRSMQLQINSAGKLVLFVAGVDSSTPFGESTTHSSNSILTELTYNELQKDEWTNFTIVSDVEKNELSVYVNNELSGSISNWNPTTSLTGAQFGTGFNGVRPWPGTMEIASAAIYNQVVLPVPEPATASLSLLGLAALMMRRRRA